jgi:SAM-dependent methyltransferase
MQRIGMAGMLCASMAHLGAIGNIVAGRSRFAWLVAISRFYTRLASPIAFLARRFIQVAGCQVESHARTCLDIGAGTAPYAEAVCREFQVNTYLAVDVAPNERTQIVADACSLPFKNGAADLIVSFDVIQHVAAPECMMQEVARVLSPGGHVLLTFPFMYAECDFHDYQRWTMEGMAGLLTRNRLIPELETRRGGAVFAAACALHWALQHIVPGQRRSWRAERSWKGIARSAVLVLLTAPTQLLAWLSLAIDSVFPSQGCYMGGAILARKLGPEAV